MSIEPCDGLVRWAMATCLAIGVFGAGATARADESLDRLLAQAMTDNPEIVAARERWEAAKAEGPQARALDDPVAGITAWSIPSDFDVSETGEVWYGLSQAFPFPGKRALKGRVADRMADAAEQAYRAAGLEVRAGIKRAYARLYRVQREIAINTEHQALLEDLVQTGLERYAVGQTTQGETLKAQVDLSILHADLLALEQEQQSLRIELNTLVGRPDAQLFFGQADVEFRPLTISVNALEAAALERRPEILAAQRELAGRDAAVSLASLDHRAPDFMAEVQYWDVHDGPNRWMVGGRMTLPWFSVSKYRSNAAQAASGRRAAAAKLDAARNETIQRVRDLFLRVTTSETVVDLYRSGIVAQAEQALESARIAYAAARTDFAHLIDAERRLRDVRLAADLALTDWAERLAELERVVGGDVR